MAKFVLYKFVLYRLENNAEKGENAGYHHFLLLLNCFQKASLTGLLKHGIFRYRVKFPPHNIKSSLIRIEIICRIHK